MVTSKGYSLVLRPPNLAMEPTARSSPSRAAAHRARWVDILRTQATNRKRDDVVVGDAGAVKRAWRIISPHGRRTARRSHGDERHGRAADVTNGASAAPIRTRRTGRRTRSLDRRSTGPARTRWPVTRRAVKRAWQTMCPHDTHAARRHENDNTTNMRRRPSEPSVGGLRSNSRKHDDGTSTQQALQPTRAGGIVSASG